MAEAEIKADSENMLRRAAVHYITGAAIMAFYGIQVCPYLETLTLTQLLVPLFGTMLVQFALRFPLRALWAEGADEKVQTKRVFLSEFALFVAAGVFLSLFNLIVYGFPAVSGLKVVVGLLTLGFFTSIDLALAWERHLVRRFQETGRHLKLDDKYFPLSGKLGLVAAASVFFILLVVFLVINKDLEWLREVGDTVSLEDAQRYILAEIAFIVAIILAHVMNVIYSFTRNLRFFFTNETTVLEEATRGCLDGSVPVGTNDEFGIMAKHTNAMVQGLREINAEVQLTRDVTILSLATLAETRDNETGAHILRTQRYVRVLAEHLCEHPRFRDQLDDELIDLLFKSAPLHDVGKVGIPDAILLKPGKLTDEEFAIMKTHAALGAEALSVAEGELGTNSFLRLAGEIAQTHHEKWDGSGYPKGLKGDAIPMSGRLMAVADVYDALISKRVYKPAFPHEKAIGIILDGKGSHFDPDVVEALQAVEEEFINIARDFRDEMTDAVGEAPDQHPGFGLNPQPAT